MWTATGTDELLVETFPGSGVLSNDYPGGEGNYESYGYYRYGFNGKENDNEVKGSGNQQDYGMRIYDPRVGRFLSVDPITKEYPELTPYQFASNSPIANIDVDGLERSFYMIALDGKTIKLISVLEVNAKIETIFGTVHNANLDNKAYLFGSDRHWHEIPGEWRNKAIGNAGEIDDVFTLINSWPNADNAYSGALKGLALQNFGQKAELALGVLVLGDGIRNLKVPNLRSLYTSSVGELKGIGQALLKSGLKEADVAKRLNQMRRGIGEAYKDLTPADLREYIYKFNKKRYGDELGPTYEYFKKQGKTDAQIIESASRPLGNQKDLGEALFKEFGEEIKPILTKYDMLK